MHKKKVLFVGAVGGMSYAARTARSAGYEVITADYYEDSQAKEYSDKAYLASTTDIGAMKKIIEEEKIEAVFTGFSDNNIQTAQKLCECYGLPCYINQEQIELLQNKQEFKKLCIRYGISVPRSYELGDNISYPVIVKPSDAYAAKGITVCTGSDELDAAVKKAEDASRNRKVVIEDYIEGKEVMVHFVMLNGKLRITNVLNRILSSSFMEEKKNLAPLIIHNCDAYLEKVLSYRERMERMFAEIGFENLVGFFQGIWDRGEIYFFEPAVRFGGNVPEVFNIHANGVDIIRKFIDYATEGRMDDEDIDRIDPEFEDFYCNLTFFLKEGTVGRMTGEAELFKIEGILDVQRFCSLGDVVDSRKTNSYGAIGYRLLMKLKDRTELQAMIGKVREHLRIEDENGNDMIDWDIFRKIDFAE